MKKICFVLPVLVAALMFFAATNASAACDSTLPVGWCFENNGVRVEILTDPLDPTQFPQIVGVNSLFKYKVTTLSGKQPINFIDIFIPQCTPDLGDPRQSASPPTGGSKYSFFNPGFGDPNTGFGLGQDTYRVFQWSYNGSGEISFTLNGKVFSYPNALFLNRGTGNYTWGQILSPACAQLPYHEFTQEVPYTVLKEVNVMGVDLCIESTDESGCPTNVFSCNVSSPSVCSCGTNTGDRTVWDKSTILDVEIPVGKLRQAWSEHDSRCPRTWWQAEGSCTTCVTVMGSVRCNTYAGISGKVYDRFGIALKDVKMTPCKTGGTCQTPVYTLADGSFCISLPTATTQSTAWTGTVKAEKPGYTFINTGPYQSPQSFSGIYRTTPPAALYDTSVTGVIFKSD